MINLVRRRCQFCTSGRRSRRTTIAKAVLKQKRLSYALICVLTSLAGMTYLANRESEYDNIETHALQPTSLRSRCSYVGFEIPKALTGVGNNLFYYSAVMYVAWLTGRRPCFSANTYLETVFDVDIPHLKDINAFNCPMYKFYLKTTGEYDRRVESLTHINETTFLLLKGHFQSWKYVEPIASQLRQRLRFRQDLINFVVNFLAKSVPRGWTTLKFVRVGVHVRRGDFLNKKWRSMGLTTASERYLQRAMSYFVERFPRVQFIVASNDILWCQDHMKFSMFNKTNVKVSFSVGHNTGQDLALLASCDHTVMTTGTYSWWAAWLANGTTIYYANYPKPNSRLDVAVRKHDYYCPKWIGIDD